SCGGDHLPDAAVASVCNEDVSRGVDEHAAGGVEFSVCGQTTVPAEAIRPIPSDGPNVSGGGHDFPNTIIEGISDENVPESIYRHAARVLECGAGSWAAIAAIPLGSVSSDGR